MPTSRFVADEFFVDPLFRLTKTTRPYFLQSRTLVLACRQLPEPPSGAAAQIEALQKLFKEVERVLYLGTITPRDHQIEDTNNKFEAAYKQLCAYIREYRIPGPDIEKVKDQPWNEPREKDRRAGRWIKEIGALAGAKLKSLKGIARLTLTVSLWPEIPRKWENGKWEYASHTLDVEIEEFASLNVLLHRLLWTKAIENALDFFSLKQNPEFYPKFPNKKSHFPPASNSRSHDHRYVPALYVWDSVEKYAGRGRILHLIVDRDRWGREIQLEDFSTLYLPEIYGNGWHLDEGDKDLIVVRDRGRSRSLLLWNVKQPAVPSVDDSSTLTLIEVPGLIPGLSIEKLDEEWESFRKMIKPTPESPPKKRGPVVAPSFDPHFASASGSMQMVGADAQAKKGGFRGWVKGKLEGFVAKS